MEELRQVLATPLPGTAASNPNAVAHAALQDLREKGDTRCLFLRTILEIVGQRQEGQHEELLFHCISGLKHVLLTKWKTFCGPFKRLVRDYFMALGKFSKDQSIFLFGRTIRLALFNASTSFWKREWKETGAEHDKPSSSPSEQTLMEGIYAQKASMGLQIPDLHSKEDLFRYLDASMVTPGLEMAFASGFLHTLVGEFTGKSASQYNMPLEFHKQAHSSFEKEGWLDRSLQMSMKALSEVVVMLNTSATLEKAKETLALTVVQLTIDVIGWEFGSSAWDYGGFPMIKGSSLVKPPLAWRSVLVQPEFVQAIFRVHTKVAHGTKKGSPELAHSIRQLILLLASLYGPIFPTPEDAKTFASFLLEGILHLLHVSSKPVIDDNKESSELLDTLSMISRLIVNYKLTILVQLPMMQPLLQGMADIGRFLLRESLGECERFKGDMEFMEHREWRDEALALLVEGIVLFCNDPWLLYSGSEESRKAAQASLATTLGPLYVEFVTCRTQMAYLEEIHLQATETDLDEVREEIYAVDLEEEMTSLAAVGRLDLQASLGCLSSFFHEIIPSLQTVWDSPAVFPNVFSCGDAGLLEKARLVTLYIGHLLTDENAGETRVIPDAIVAACQDNQVTCDAVVSAVQLLQQFAEYQVSKMRIDPKDERLSPLLGKTFLWFFNRWAPAYILPDTYGPSSTPSKIALAWSSTEKAQESISFLISLCLHYNCYWSQEGQVQENAAMMLLSLAKRGPEMRLAMVSCPQFRQLVMYYCLTCGIRHSAPPEEIETTVRTKAGQTMNLDMRTMIRGFHRLPYDVKGKLLTGILMACGEKEDETSCSLLNECFTATQDAFSSLVNVLSTKQLKPDHVDAKEMACLCISLYDGVALAGDMKGAERIPKFLSPSLAHLSGLMEFYAEDLTICEGLLRFFKDYSYQFISILDSSSCAALFQASSNLLKSYSTNHCSSTRVIASSGSPEEEEQKYSDVLCAIELLVQLGSKDFFYSGEQSVDSVKVSEMIFVGLQQILPLMTRGLLQYPTLCSQFLQLVGFMLESYAEQLKILPYELFDALLESLLYGMTYHDATIGKCSLQGIGGIAREHLKSQVLDVHVAATPPSHEGLIEKCTRRLLTEVVFQNVIWDRLESAGMALLPLAAIDIHSFGRVVQGIAQQVPPENQQRLISSFEMLIRADVIASTATKGHEGRKNRILFKKDFEAFCHEIHSFMLKK